MTCVFCDIAQGRASASLVYEDDAVLAFLSLHQVRDGECIVVPRSHVDHFFDLPEELAVRLFRVAHHLARVLHAEFQPLRTGLVVSGFGVAHAHIIVLPLHTDHDISSVRFLVMENGAPRLTAGAVPESPRSELDARAERIRMRYLESSSG